MSELFAIPNCSGYFLSKDGTVWSAKKRGPHSADFRYDTPHALKPFPRGPYLSVCLKKDDGSPWHASIHVVMLLTFKGPRPEGHEACHNDGNAHNNHIDNLRWDTRSSNSLDRRNHGTMPCGTRHYKSMLNENDVIIIRKRILNGEPLRKIANDFGVSRECINCIKHRRNWAWL